MPKPDDAIQRLTVWIREYGHEKQPAFIEDLTTVLETIKDLRDRDYQATTLLANITDVAICKIEGAAHELRRIAGYVEGPYPPLERQ